MHDELLRPAQLTQLPLRREAVAPSESVLAPHDKPPVTAPPRVRPPSMLGMPWRWL